MITIRRFRHCKRGVSNVIVVMMSLILVTIIVANVVLWSYQMNQVDWEKMQERIALINVEHVTYSPWFTAYNEFTIVTGSRVAGSFTSTKTLDEQYETFSETSDPYGLNISLPFLIDLITYSKSYMKALEIQIHYRTSDASEIWFLKAFNWTDGEYDDAGFNSTISDTPSSEFKLYAIRIFSGWKNYVHDNSTMKLCFFDSGADAVQTVVNIDFVGIRALIDGTAFAFRNEGPVTCRIASIWMINATVHTRYEADYFVNSGLSTCYTRADISFFTGNFSIKAVTSRGNIALFSMN